jgi:uncharacterized repeat protein (TIGR01451 family)
VDTLLGDLLDAANPYVTSSTCTAVLPTGGSCVIEATRTVQAGDPDPLWNEVEVHYNPDGFPNDISAEDDHEVELFQPDVMVEKTGDTLSKATDPVDYTITVTNLSSPDSPDLVNGTIVDTLLGDLLDAANPYVTSSTCTAVLPTGGSCVIEATRTVQAGDPDPLKNTVTVHYNPDGFPNDITDSDDHEVNLFQPSVKVTKTGDPYSKVGDTVTYQVTIENTSSSDTPNLILYSFSDSLVPGVVPPAECNSLAPGASCSFSYQYQVQAGDDLGYKGALMENTATVHYNPDGFPNDISHSDTWNVELLHPDFTVSKECMTPLVAPGSDAEFEIVFANTGDVDLIVTADEDLDEAGVIIPAGTEFNLPEGESKTFTVKVTAGYAETVDNAVNATATLPEWTGLPNELRRSASDSCEVAARIIIHKVTTPPSDRLFDFQTNYYDFSLRDGEFDDTGWTMAAGSYWVTEIEPMEWGLESITCVDPTGDTTVDLGNETAWIELSGGETVECTFVNKQLYLAYTPGFWKTHGPDTNAGPSDAPHNAWQYTHYLPTNLFCEVFVDSNGENPCMYFPEVFRPMGQDKTLMEALYMQGGRDAEGKAEILARHAVAALLNADLNEVQAGNHGFGDYPYGSQEVIDLTVAAFASGDPDEMVKLASDFDRTNNGGSDYFDWTGWDLITPQ